MISELGTAALKDHYLKVLCFADLFLNLTHFAKPHLFLIYFEVILLLETTAKGSIYLVLCLSLPTGQTQIYCGFILKDYSWEPSSIVLYV